MIYIPMKVGKGNMLILPRNEHIAWKVKFGHFERSQLPISQSFEVLLLPRKGFTIQQLDAVVPRKSPATADQAFVALMPARSYNQSQLHTIYSLSGSHKCRACRTYVQQLT